jgi:hypothetical protein
MEDSNFKPFTKLKALSIPTTTFPSPPSPLFPACGYLSSLISPSLPTSFSAGLPLSLRRVEQTSIEYKAPILATSDHGREEDYSVSKFHRQKKEKAKKDASSPKETS